MLDPLILIGMLLPQCLKAYNSASIVENRKLNNLSISSVFSLCKINSGFPCSVTVCGFIKFCL